MQRDNEADIIEDLYRLYEQGMFRRAYGILHDEYLAEDAVHEAFLRLIRRRSKIADPQSPEVRAYVYKALRSAAVDLYRKQKRQREHCVEYEDSAEEQRLEETVPFGVLEPSQSEELIAALPQKYASVMRCLFLDGLTVRETAAVLKLREACVRKRCERARMMLKSIQSGNNVQLYL